MLRTAYCGFQLQSGHTKICPSIYIAGVSHLIGKLPVFDGVEIELRPYGGGDKNFFKVPSIFPTTICVFDRWAFIREAYLVKRISGRVQ